MDPGSPLRCSNLVAGGRPVPGRASISSYCCPWFIYITRFLLMRISIHQPVQWDIYNKFFWKTCKVFFVDTVLDLSQTLQRGFFSDLLLNTSCPIGSENPTIRGKKFPGVGRPGCSDSQVWGFYLCLAPHADLSKDHFLVPWLETFWYAGASGATTFGRRKWASLFWKQTCAAKKTCFSFVPPVHRAR